MKNLLLLYLVVLCNVGSSYGQQYQPFPEKDAYWIYINQTGNYGYHSQFYPAIIYHQYMLSGADTVINGHSYRTIVERRFEDSTYTLNTPIPSYTNKIANVPDKVVLAIRQDNKKVLAVRFPSTTEFVLYDFNKVVGDTFFIAYNDSFSRYGTIKAQDSVLVGNKYHKRWQLDYAAPYVIEGLGSIAGLYGILNGQNYCELACFNSLNGSYSYGSGSCFYIHPYGTPAGISEAFMEVAVISPNPFGDYIKVQSGEQVDIRVYNINGQEVIREDGVLDKLLDTRSLQQGMYFVKVLLNGETVQTIKLLK